MLWVRVSAFLSRCVAVLLANPELFEVQLTFTVLVTQIEHLTKTLKAYYDQRQATACECARSAKRRNVPSGPPA
jgi:hypothetical protein